MGWVALVWLGVPFALSGSLPAETASAREIERERLMRDGSREQVLCGTRLGSGLAGVVHERRLEGSFRADEDGGR